MAESPIRVLVVDDHVSFSWSLAFVFDHLGDLKVVSAPHSLAEARRVLADGLAFDVALIDLDLQDGSGLDLIPEACASNRGAYAVVLSGTATERSRALAVAAGAAGVLDKANAGPHAIAEQIRALCRGEPLISPAEAVDLVAKAAIFQREERAVRQAFASLTPRERDILQAIADGLSDKRTAERLSLSERTVGNHVAGLLRKLDVDSRLQALILAARVRVVRIQG